MKIGHHLTFQTLGLERERPLDSVSFFLLLAFIASAPFPWGSVLPAGLLKLELFAFVILALTLASSATLARLGAIRLPVMLLTAVASLGVLQLIPMSSRVLGWFSPASLAVFDETNRVRRVFGEADVVARISIAPAETFGMTLFTLALVALFISSAVLLDSRRRRRTFLAVFLGSAVAQTLFATATFGARTTGRVGGPFVNPNHFAGWLEIAFACALAVLWREALVNRDRETGATDRGDRIERRLLPLALSALLVGTLGTGIGLTRSRGGIAAAVLMTLVVVALGMTHRRVRRRTRVVSLGIVMIVLAFLFIAITAKQEPILRYLESDPREIGADTRVLLWRTSLEAWREFPVFGSGLGTFREAYRGVQPREIGQLVEQAHSDPLQLLVTGGIVGFALGIAAFISCLTILVRSYRLQEHREESAWVLGGIGALVVLAIHGLVEFNFSIPAIPATLACIVGFATAAGGWREE